MKYGLFAISLLLILLISCRSHRSVPELPGGMNIIGTWKYIESSGGFTGKGAGYPQATVLFFDKKGTYSRAEDGKVVQTGNYSIAKGTSIHSESAGDLINYSNGVSQSFFIQRDTLFLSDEVHDGFQFKYSRDQ